MTGILKTPPDYGVRGSETRQKIRRILEIVHAHRGRAAAVSMHAIAAETGIDTRSIQAIVKFLVEERHLPIGTATAPPYGYYQIVNLAERREVRNQFVRRALSNLQHAKAYDCDSIVGPLMEQLEMDFPEVKQQ